MFEELAFTLNLTVVGLLVVFGVLWLIAIVIGLVKKADDRWEAREAAADEAALTAEQNIDNLTLVLISAAVATMIQGRFHVRRIRRLMPGDPVSRTWSMQGRAVLHGSHVVTRKR